MRKCPRCSNFMNWSIRRGVEYECLCCGWNIDMIGASQHLRPKPPEHLVGVVPRASYEVDMAAKDATIAALKSDIAAAKAVVEAAKELIRTRVRIHDGAAMVGNKETAALSAALAAQETRT